MKVQSVEPFVLRVPPAEVYWGARSWQRVAYSPTVDTVLVRVEDEDGVVGWGECKAPVAPGAAALLVRELLAPLVIGSRLDEIAVTWERMYTAMRVRGHSAGFWLEALSGVDIALWDAWARRLGQPVHALLGGAFRTEVPVYASGIPAASSAAGLGDVREQAGRLVDAGFTAVKVAVGIDPAGDLASVGAIRDVFGPDGRIFVDAAGGYDLPQAVSVGRGLAELGVGFFEMPLPPEDVEGYRVLAGKLDLPLALDSLANRFQALAFLRAGALHVLQPDVCRAGGITETMRIAQLAETFGCAATPHVSIGSAVHFAASLQCAAAISDFDVLEHWVGDNPLGTAIAADLDKPVDGKRKLPAAPGLGITVDETAVRRLSAGKEFQR